jgi:hypothetical protein
MSLKNRAMATEKKQVSKVEAPKKTKDGIKKAKKVLISKEQIKVLFNHFNDQLAELGHAELALKSIGLTNKLTDTDCRWVEHCRNVNGHHVCTNVLECD